MTNRSSNESSIMLLYNRQNYSLYFVCVRCPRPFKLSHVTCVLYSVYTLIRQPEQYSEVD